MSLGERLQTIRGRTSLKDFSDAFGVAQNTIRKYELDKGAPGTDYVLAICDHYNINPLWVITGDGPMYRDGREALPTAPSSVHAVAAPKDQDPFDAIGMAEGMGLLAEIYSSGDNIYIRAINANLMAFSDAVKTKSEAVVMKETVRQMQAEILKMREQFNELKQEVLALRNENSELKRELRARDGNNCEAATG
jgi:transcriptional regulator with XRE-family HTH domain